MIGQPANILVSEDCTLKIGDFGQAVLNGTREAEGDSRYLAPELLDDENPEGAGQCMMRVAFDMSAD